MTMGLQHLLRALGLALVFIASAMVFAPAQANDNKTVRLAVVNTPAFSGLIDALIADFKTASGYDVKVTSGNGVFDWARNGDADIVIAHYGKADVQRFVLDGYGRWPHLLFSNQLVLAGPKSDPAKIKGMASASDALRRIADAKAPFVPNALPGITYLTEILWEKAGRPDKKGWFLDTDVRKGRAIRYAESNGAYVIWGALPFMRFLSKHASEMEVMVSQDPLLQRVMASIVVNPDKVAGANAEGAEALQKYLMTPAVQAKIAMFRSPGSDLQFWWPMARSNASSDFED